MKLERYPDWSQRVAALIRDRARRPFAWGVNDCAIFAADAVLAATGQDLALTFRGRYRSRRGAGHVLRAHGWASLEELGDAVLPRSTERPRRGDVVLYAGRNGNFLGVVWSAGVAGPDDTGVRLWPLDQDAILATWSVG